MFLVGRFPEAHAAYQRGCRLENPDSCRLDAELLAAGALGEQDRLASAQRMVMACHFGDPMGCRIVAQMMVAGWIERSITESKLSLEMSYVYGFPVGSVILHRLFAFDPTYEASDDTMGWPDVRILVEDREGRGDRRLPGALERFVRELAVDPQAYPREIVDACEQGGTASCGVAGVLLSDVNEQISYGLLRRSCDAGHYFACDMLRDTDGEISIEATAAECSRGNVLACYDLSARRGDVLGTVGLPLTCFEDAACERLARECESGDGRSCSLAVSTARVTGRVRVDEELLSRWLALGCEVGDAESCYFSARAAYFEEGGARVATEQMRSLCDTGHAAACYWLADVEDSPILMSAACSAGCFAGCYSLVTARASAP